MERARRSLLLELLHLSYILRCKLVRYLMFGGHLGKVAKFNTTFQVIGIGARGLSTVVAEGRSKIIEGAQ